MSSYDPFDQQRAQFEKLRRMASGRGKLIVLVHLDWLPGRPIGAAFEWVE